MVCPFGAADSVTVFVGKVSRNPAYKNLASQVSRPFVEQGVTAPLYTVRY